MESEAMRCLALLLHGKIYLNRPYSLDGAYIVISTRGHVQRSFNTVNNGKCAARFVGLLPKICQITSCGGILQECTVRRCACVLLTTEC
jgi:hypothetical protein